MTTINRIKIDDMRQYDSARCNDGGCYGYTDTYIQLDKGLWRAALDITYYYEEEE